MGKRIKIAFLAHIKTVIREGDRTPPMPLSAKFLAWHQVMNSKLVQPLDVRSRF